MSKKGLEKNMRKNGGINRRMTIYKKLLSGDDTIDMKKTNKWLHLRLSSHAEGYLSAIQEQELDVKETRRSREKYHQKNKEMDTTCRICHQRGESVYHLVCSCPVLAPTLYLNVGHNQIARILYQEILKSDELTIKPPLVTKKEEMEIWWDEPVQTIGKVEKNKPDMILWYTDKKLCLIVEITVPLDINLKTAYKEKEFKYIPLISNMQHVYSEYRFQMVIISLGAMGAIHKNMEENIEKLHFTKDRIKVVTERLQKAALIGTMKICKTAMRM